MRIITARRRALAVALLALSAAAACDDDDDGGAIFGPEAPNRVFRQIDRLGNPLVSEVFLEKRSHGFHNAGMPSTDVATFKAPLEAFVATVAGRNTTVQTTLSGVLLPDMLIVQTDKPAASAGWLTWALADGYGGRKLTDDVVDAGLAAIFGPLLSTENVSPGLASDNLAANDEAFGTAFPYLAEPH
ncbi:MAG TPA: DUF4331 family protein [Gemmatimonadaceae bacterium]|nr:DUF4331 family protein [Gemmatimonadaceae bacterium]